jgi:hypothetical protein
MSLSSATGSERISVSAAYRVAIFDINFKSTPRTGKVTANSMKARNDELTRLPKKPDARADQGVEGPWTAYDRSYEWLFYGEGHAEHERRASGEKRDPRLPQSLPGLQRFIVQGLDKCYEGKVSSAGAEDCGWSLLVAREQCVGVASFWFKAAWTSDEGTLSEVLRFKQRPILEFVDVAQMLQPLGEVTAQERQHTLLALRLASPDTPRDAIRTRDPDLGRVFVGGDEFADDTAALDYIQEDQSLSHRSYECMFVRWTDTLLIYNRTVDGMLYEDELRKAITRATQVIELCVLLRRLLRNVGSDIEQASARPLLVPWPARGTLLRPFSELEQDYKISPPYRTPEGERLVTESFARFGVDRLFDSTRRASDLLERRLESVETQWALVVAIVAILIGAIVQLAFGSR